MLYLLWAINDSVFKLIYNTVLLKNYVNSNARYYIAISFQKLCKLQPKEWQWQKTPLISHQKQKLVEFSKKYLNKLPWIQTPKVYTWIEPKVSVSWHWNLVNEGSTSPPKDVSNNFHIQGVVSVGSYPYFPVKLNVRSKK